jgi:hypothetical protein
MGVSYPHSQASSLKSKQKSPLISTCLPHSPPTSPSYLRLGDHNPVGIAVHLADLHLDVVVVESLEELVAVRAVLGALFVADAFPLQGSSSQQGDPRRGPTNPRGSLRSPELTSSLTATSNCPFNTLCRNPRSVLEWKRQMTHLPFSIAAKAS